MKTCSKCETEKSRSEFHKHHNTKDGLQATCKTCQKKEGKKWRRENKDRSLKCLQEWREKNKEIPDSVRETRRKAAKKYREEYIEEVRCRSILNEAVRCGKIKRPNTCESCFKECKPEGHHEDYSRPFDVDWLCIECHKRLHREMLVCQ